MQDSELTASPRYYFLLIRQQRQGPHEQDALREMVLQGQLDRSTPCWTQGLDGWYALEAVVPELAPLLPPEVPPADPGHAETYYHQEEQDDESTTALSHLDPENRTPRYLYISITRLVIMSLFSAGLYWVYWMYKNWCYVKQGEKLSIWPFWRSVFNQFFFHSLLTHLKKDARMNAIRPLPFNENHLYFAWLAVWVITFVFSQGNPFVWCGPHILGVMSNGLDLPVMASLLSVMTVIAGTALLARVQFYINEVNRKAGASTEAFPLSSPGHIVVYTVSTFGWWTVLVAVFNNYN